MVERLPHYLQYIVGSSNINFMFDLILDNTDNDKTLPIKLPIVPRIGDWVSVDYEDEFTEGESLLTVQNVILSEDKIIIIVTGSY